MNELSIVIPCVSSARNLLGFINELVIFLLVNPSDVDIIVVANEKSDSIEQVSESIRKKYPWLKFTALQRNGHPRNYGALSRFGIAYSSSRYIALLSSYEEDDISIIQAMLSKARNGAQVVQATRYATLNTTKNIPFSYKAYQNVYRFLIWFLFGFRVSDSTYGFKMFDRVFIQALGLSQNGYSICPEITLKALLAGGKVDYVATKVKSVINKDFKIYKEGIGYLGLLLHGFLHKIGILWF